MKTPIAYLHFVVLFWLSLGSLAEELLVRLNHGGGVRGSVLKSQKGRPIYAFRGIPYGEPPTGERRFKPPIAKSPWKGQPFDATNDGPICIHQEYFPVGIVGQEDCLNLNVYTPKGPDDVRNGSKLAVMVFIHGGSFASGSAASTMYGPSLLLDKNIILVAMNYRVGPFGFLSTGDKASPGNYGLMDQTLAMKWVKDNIDVFGGDVDKITVFGESAGAASVGYHILSPMSAGLFHHAIAQSGSPLCQWALQRNPLYWAEKLGSMFKCSNQSTVEMVECLRKIPATDIIENAIDVTSLDWSTIYQVIFAYMPTIDGSFLPSEPKDMLTSGKVNKVSYLSGINKDEGLLGYSILHKFIDASAMQQTIQDLFKKLFGDDAGILIMQRYFSKVIWTNEEDVRQVSSKAFSDASFTKMHYEMVKLLLDNGFRTYTYSLDYTPSVSVTESVFGITEKWGVCHGDDLAFLFDSATWPLRNSTADDQKIMSVMCSAWTDFAKYGNPTPNLHQDDPMQWKLSTNDAMQVYHIDNPVKTLKYIPEADDLFHFWTEVVPSLDPTKANEHVLNNGNELS